jgi:hypothetical protein
MSNAKLWTGPVYLEPIEHKYIHRKTGKKYKSVTTTLTSIEPHFDVEGVSAAIVAQADDKKQERYIGLTQQEIIDFWQMLNVKQDKTPVISNLFVMQKTVTFSREEDQDDDDKI